MYEKTNSQPMQVSPKPSLCTLYISKWMLSETMLHHQVLYINVTKHLKYVQRSSKSNQNGLLWFLEMVIHQSYHNAETYGLDEQYYTASKADHS